MTKKKKIILLISLVLIVLAVISGIMIKKYTDYINDYRNLYNEYYNKFVDVFEFYGEPNYSNGKLKIINAKCRAGNLALKINLLEEKGIAVTNYLDFFEDYYNKKEENDIDLIGNNREAVDTSAKTQSLTNKLNLGIDLYEGTSPELFNNWLDKAVKEYILKKYELKPPKGF